MTLFYRPPDQINTDRFKYTKMGNELLMSLRWELLSGVQEDIEFGWEFAQVKADPLFVDEIEQREEPEFRIK